MKRLWSLLETSEEAESLLQHALKRACLQGQLRTADWLLGIGAHVEQSMVMGCCETLNSDGLGYLLDHGVELCDADGDRTAPVTMLLQTYWRAPEGKHQCLDLVECAGFEFPDTPLMAFHRGRVDLLEDWLLREPDLIHRRFSLRELYPLEAGCSDDVAEGLHGTPLDGATLLHMAIDFDEHDTFAWLFTHAADVNAKAEVDDQGFGGHTPLFNAVVSQATACGRQADGAMAKALLDRGASPRLRTTLRKHLRGVGDDAMKEYLNVTAVDYAEAFPDPRWVNSTAVEMIRACQ